MKKIFVLAVILLALPACINTNPLLDPMDQMVNKSICPEYLEYVDNDSTLTPYEKEMRHKAVQTYKNLIEEAKK